MIDDLVVDGRDREEAGPIVGMKAARLVEVASRLFFAPIFLRQKSSPYGADAEAVCELARPHVAPAQSCSCGFHAVATRDELWRLGALPSAVFLDVELSGMVVVHEFGWRASHQSVLGVDLPAHCALRKCVRPSVGIAPYRSFFEAGMTGWTRLRPVCAQCAKKRVIPVPDIASALGVEVSIESGDLQPVVADARTRCE